MLNNRTTELGSRRSRLFWLAVILLHFIFIPLARSEKPVRYKKQTVVDFEDALVEGKSRKPYSAYLSKQKSEEMHDLFDWDLDLNHRIGLSGDEVKFHP